MDYTEIAHHPFVQIVERLLEGDANEAKTIALLLGVTRIEFRFSDPIHAIKDFWPKGGTIPPEKWAFMGYCLRHDGDFSHLIQENAISLFFWAAKANDTKTVRLLIDAGADVNAPGFKGFTAIHWAATFGDPEVLKPLIDAKGDVNIRSVSGTTPLYCAALRGHSESLKLLIDAGADVTVENDKGETPLMGAKRRGRSEIVRILNPDDSGQPIEFESVSTGELNDDE